VLLLVLAHAAHASGNIPGKLFEYLASGNEIIGVGVANGDSATILAQAGAGKVYDPSDINGLEQAFQNCFENWKAKIKPNAKTFSKYSRSELTDSLIALLEKLN
jgi:glycosyltransferase involved in cell wall biosynthesis